MKRLAHLEDWLFAGTSDGVYRTALHDTGAAWTPLGLQGDTIEALLVLSPDTLFASVRITAVGNDTVLVFRSTNAGGSWEPAQSGLGEPAASLRVSTLARLPAEPSELLAGGSTFALAKSPDLGASWRDVWSGGWVSFAQEHPHHPGTVWAGGETGFFQPFLLTSTDAGEHWDEHYLNVGGGTTRVTARPLTRRSRTSCTSAWRVASSRRPTRAPVGPPCSAPSHIRTSSGLRRAASWPTRVYAARAVNAPPGEVPLELHVSHDRGGSWSVTAHPSARFGAAWDLLLWSDGRVEMLFQATPEGVYRYRPPVP